MGHKPNFEYHVEIYKTVNEYFVVRVEEEHPEIELAAYLSCFETASVNPFSVRAGRELGVLPIYFVKDFNHYITLMKNKIILLSS